MFSRRRISLLLVFIVCFSAFCVPTSSAAFVSLDVSAQSAVLLDANSGDVLFSKNENERLPMASTTKIMTALVAIENSDIADTVSVDAEAVGVEGSSVYLCEGELLTMENLLYALLLASANDAAATIAIAVAGSIEAFADMMNAKAEDLGLENTHFENPHGLDSETHYTSALDLAKLTAEALKNETFSKIVSTYKTTIPMNSGTRVLINHNKLLRTYKGAIGVKTGFTKRSGRCLVSAAERDGLKLIAVTINAPNDWQDHTAMLDCGFAAYKKLVALGDTEYTVSLPVINGKDQTVLCSNVSQISATVPSNIGIENCTFTIKMPHFLYAPVEKGDKIGTIVCSFDGKVIGESDILSQYSVEAVVYKKSIWQRICDFFLGIFS